MGGSSGSGTSTGDYEIVKKAANQSGYTGSDLDKAGQATEKAVTGGVKKAEETVKAATDVKPPPVKVNISSEGFDEFGRRIKNSDLGKAVSTIADKSGFTGSDADKALQKIETESKNIVNQTSDFVKNPAGVVNAAIDRAKNFGAETAGEIQAVGKAYETAGKNIETTGQNIVGAFQDTFQTGMNAASALGQNLANQLGTASGDKGGLKGQSRSNLSELLEQNRKARRGGLSRSGTSRTLITGKV